MANVSKQIVTQSLARKKYPLTFAQFTDIGGNATKCERRHSPSLVRFYCTIHISHFRETNAFICRLFGVRLVYVYEALYGTDLMPKRTIQCRHKEFRDGHTSATSLPQSGRLWMNFMKVNKNTVAALIAEVLHISQRQVANAHYTRTVLSSVLLDQT